MPNMLCLHSAFTSFWLSSLISKRKQTNRFSPSWLNFFNQPDVNAFSMPGGKIVVFTGLLNQFKSDAEVATVIGHEKVILLRLDFGFARGMSPKARVAAYKVCWVGGCFSSDILSAVAGGVQVLSISLGGGISTYSRDRLSIATFGAMEMGVFVSCSAGNGGPDPISLTNVSPWITTVGASTMDRDFPATVKLGTMRTFKGVSLYKGRAVLSRNKQYPLVYLGRNASSPDPTSFCLDGALDRRHVSGKIVISDRGVSPRVQKGQVVKRAGGIGVILTNTATNGEELVADSSSKPKPTL